jgi:Flp pilus assembly protein TadB
MVNPEHMSILWQDKLGLKLIYAAAIMTLIGGLIIRKIVNIRI